MKSYNDIINLPHYVSKERKHMSNYDRAAQFAPFAALTGYDSQIDEAARYVDKKIELAEDSEFLLNAKLQIIRDKLDLLPEVFITYFIADKYKSGGKYVTEKVVIKNFDLINRQINLQNKASIPIDDIIEIEAEILR
ncbi:MAG: hypothetical protein KBT46_06860 [Ruminococcus sp.]|nr:hypothetical protein [Candidatus Copronaster equi]